MTNFWDFSMWGTLNIFAVLLISLLIANVLKNAVGFLRVSLIPTSVLGGMILLVISGLFNMFTGEVMFNTPFFGENGIAMLEIITYHTLALGFIASGLKSSKNKFTKERTVEIFDTGVTTVATYLIQGICGMLITIIAAAVLKNFFPAAGLLLPFGFGQGTGQALNFGNIYETDFGFDGGRSFGLTIAALGFLSASIGGVIHLNILRRQGKIDIKPGHAGAKLNNEKIEEENEIPMQGSMDKVTVQMAAILLAYFITHLMMLIVGNLVPGFKSVIYGFNFIFGVLTAALIKAVMNFLHNKNIVKRRYMNNFLLTRCSNFFFDIMVVAGIAAIRLSVLEKYWGIMLVIGVAGLAVTYIYNRIVAKTLFGKYVEEQFLMMYGMLTGTASTGVILLREIDDEFETPAADNMVYQTFPAIVFGFPLMLIATYAPKDPIGTVFMLLGFFVVMNLILFRRQIFRRKKKA